MGLMDNFISAMKLGGDENEGYEDGEYLDEPDEELNVGKTKTADVEDENARKSVIPKTNIARKQKVSGNGMEVCVIKPTSMEDTREITDTLRSNRTVVLNMEGVDVSLAQRIIDYASGTCYAISGNLQKISNYIFIITPPSVEISGDFPEILSGAIDVP